MNWANTFCWQTGFSKSIRSVSLEYFQFDIHDSVLCQELSICCCQDQFDKHPFRFGLMYPLCILHSCRQGSCLQLICLCRTLTMNGSIWGLIELSGQLKAKTGKTLDQHLQERKKIQTFDVGGHLLQRKCF